MTTTFTPPPTYADPVIVDEVTKNARFNPIWLKWFVDMAEVISALPASVGTVTSVAQTVPAEFSVAGSPVTSAGTLAISKVTQTANYVWAGPSGGAPAQPNFRKLVSADMPAGLGTVTSVSVTTANGVSGTVATATTTPAISLTLGAIAPTSVVATTGLACGAATVQSGGVAFPATAVAVTNANTLDDYEEGSWTPSLGGNTTYNAQTGIYVRIGQLVYFTGYLNIATIGTGATTSILGLPFTAINTSNMYQTAGVNYFASLASSIVYITLEINVNTTNMSIYSLTAAAATIGSSAIFGNGAVLYFSGMYIAA